MQELSNYLGIEKIEKIEGYDVSHFSGDNAVASCVAFSKQGPQKRIIDCSIFRRIIW